HEFLSPNFHAPLAVCFELMLGLAMAAAVWHLLRRRFHYPLLTIAAAHMALVSARNIPLFLIVAAVPVALAAGEWAKWSARKVARTRPVLHGFLRLSTDIGSVERACRIPALSALATAILAAALFAPAASGKFRSEFDPRVFPVRAIDEVRKPGSRIFTS